MKSKQKMIIIISCIILLFVVIFLSRYLITRTVLSEPGTIGNTAANLYNGGLFCERDGVIYFSNINDSGSLYSMDSDCTNIRKIYNDNASYINVDENYVFYSRNNNRRPKESQGVFKVFNNGLFRVTHKGKNLKKLYGSPTGTVLLYDNNIYYQHYSEETGIQIYKTDLAGKNEQAVTDEDIIPVSAYNNQIYYSGVEEDHGIHMLNLSTLQSSSVLDSFTYMPVATENYIYYIATTNGYNICRINHDGTGNTIIVDEFCSSYNLSSDGKYIFYQIDGGDNNRLCSMELATGNVQTILSGDFNRIHVTSQYLFFSTFDGSTSYIYSLDGSEKLSVFNPNIE